MWVLPVGGRVVWLNDVGVRAEMGLGDNGGTTQLEEGKELDLLMHVVGIGRYE